MKLSETPTAERLHIGFFGRRNAGKSSLVNAVTGQALAIVSPTLGTTTDPVAKSMELLPLGPVVIVDTPGWDDSGLLGEQRVEKSRQVLRKTDLAVLVVDSSVGLQPDDRELLALLDSRRTPYLIAWNKADLLASQPPLPEGQLYVSAQSGQGVGELKEALARLGAAQEPSHCLIRDLLRPEQLVILVTPIDEAAPKGRLILPQQLVLREVLDAQAQALVVQTGQLAAALAGLKQPPALVITDSQAFRQAAVITPDSVALTSFSILMARGKGTLAQSLAGLSAVARLRDGDRILIAEGCTHHRQCGDIGTVKIPNWLRQHSGRDFTIEACSGREFPADLSPYALIVHCGGCMLNGREMAFRLEAAAAQHIPITNYGLLIAFMQGILPRSLAFLPERAAWQE